MRRFERDRGLFEGGTGERSLDDRALDIRH